MSIFILYYYFMFNIQFQETDEISTLISQDNY